MRLFDIIVLAIALAAMFGITYLFSIRPQKKQAKKHQAMLEETKKGDEIVTIGGILGRVYSIKDDKIVLELAPDNIKIKIIRSAIATNLTALKNEEE